jgi:hypothetical protein
MVWMRIVLPKTDRSVYFCTDAVFARQENRVCGNYTARFGAAWVVSWNATFRPAPFIHSRSRELILIDSSLEVCVSEDSLRPPRVDLQL